MRLTPNMLRVLKALHNAEDKRGVATYSTAIALSTRNLASILNGGFPARTQGQTFPELSIELTEKGLVFCNQRFSSVTTEMGIIDSSK